MSGNEIERLTEAAQDYGIELSLQQLNLLRIYLDELCHWNRRMNLTGLTRAERIMIELILDSLMAAPFLPERGIMLDVGSGAGVPGVPLKIYRPQLITRLLEANSKKVSFLRHVIRLLGLKDIEVIRGRVEMSESYLHPDGYDIITARALADIRQTIRWCAPLLRPGGLLVSYLGRYADGEIKGSAEIMGKQKLIIYNTIPYRLPGKKHNRSIVLIKKRHDLNDC